METTTPAYIRSKSVEVYRLKYAIKTNEIVHPNVYKTKVKITTRWYGVKRSEDKEKATAKRQIVILKIANGRLILAVSEEP